MLQILTYEHIERAEWSRLVLASTTGTWFQTLEAYDFFASQPKLFMPFAFGLIDDQSPKANHKSQLRAVCVGYVTLEKSALKQFFTRRAIIIGGPALANDATDQEVHILMMAVKDFLKSQAIYIETRNFNDYSRWKDAFAKAGFNYQPHLNFHVACANKKAMDANISDNRKRQIKKALKNGAQIVEAQDEKEITDWYGILKELYQTKVKTPLFPLSFFLEFYRQGVGKYLLVKYEGNVIGGIMCPVFDNKCIYEWFVCGMDTEYRDLSPSVMATYAAMEYGHAHGLARFDVMGAGKPDKPYGVRDFKAEFGGTMVEHGRFLHVPKTWLYKIGTWGVWMLKQI